MPIASIASWLIPNSTASLLCACHSYRADQKRAVIRIANSLRAAGREFSKRMLSPRRRTRSVNVGLRKSALNGPRMPPRGPLINSSAIDFCSGVISSRGIGAKRFGDVVIMLVPMPFELDKQTLF